VKRWGRGLGLAVLAFVLLGGVGTLVWRLMGAFEVAQRPPVTTVMKVVLPPPPPPPPQPQRPPPPTTQKMIEQPKVVTPQQAKTDQPKQAAPKSAGPAKAAGPPGNPLTADAAPGANPYGLSAGNGDGDTIGGGGGGGGGGGSRFGYYAGLIQSQVQSALQRDEKTRTGRYGVLVRLWLNASGHVTRAQIANSTADAATDQAISRVLDQVSVGEAPPQDMPQPISVRIGASSG
jgi:TonB family protein